MNVLPTQHALFRQLDAAALVAQLQQAAEQAQRQMAISHLREAHRSEELVSQAEAALAGAAVSSREHQKDERRPGSGKLSPSSKEEEKPLKDAPNITPLGHHLDITA